MKTLFTTVALTGGLLVAVAGAANAATYAQCQVYAQQQADIAYPPLRGAATGGLLGALGGAGIAAATGGNVGKGAAAGGVIGGGTGIVLYQNKKQAYLNQVLQSCLASGVPAQPVYAPQPPAYIPPPPPYLARITGSGLNVRNAPSTSGTAVLFTLHATDLFQILQCEQPTNAGWCWIDFNGANGWVARSYTVPAS